MKKKIFVVLLLNLSMNCLLTASPNKFSKETVDQADIRMWDMPPISSSCNIAEVFKEVDSSFHIKGKPIHPQLIEQFIPSMFYGRWLPKVAAVDILNAGNNQNVYFPDFEYSKRGSTFNCNVFVAHGLTAEYYEYTWLGKLKSGLHVVETTESGGGTIVFTYLHFFKFVTSDAYAPNGDKYSQILLTLVRNYPLGDRTEWKDKEVDFANNKITITFSDGSKKSLIINE